MIFLRPCIVENDPKYLFNLTEPSNYCFFGYDTMMFIANALDTFDKQHGLISHFEESVNMSTDLFYETFLIEFEQILRNQSLFSLTGRLEVDEIGDRANPINAYGNILPNGKINFFGLLTADPRVETSV